MKYKGYSDFSDFQLSKMGLYNISKGLYSAESQKIIPKGSWTERANEYCIFGKALLE